MRMHSTVPDRAPPSVPMRGPARPYGPPPADPAECHSLGDRRRVARSGASFRGRECTNAYPPRSVCTRSRKAPPTPPSRRDVKVLPPLLHTRPSHLRTGLLAMRCACRATDAHSPCTKTLRQMSRPVPTRNNHLDPPSYPSSSCRVGSASQHTERHTWGTVRAIWSPLDGRASLCKQVGGIRNARWLLLGAQEKLEGGHAGYK